MSDAEVLRICDITREAVCPLHVLLTVLKTTGPDSKLCSSNCFSRQKARASPQPLTPHPFAPETRIWQQHGFLRNGRSSVLFSKLHFHQRPGFLVIRLYRKHWSTFADHFKSRADLNGTGEGRGQLNEDHLPIISCHM